jgi:hypothetical protein
LFPRRKPPVILYEQQSSEAICNLTQAVDILAYVGVQEIPSTCFETPYYLAPAPGGEKDYAQLRDTLRRTQKIGIAYVVIRARQHLAVLIPYGQSLVLNTLRWSQELGTRDEWADTGEAGEYESGPPSRNSQSGLATPLQQVRVTGCGNLDLNEWDWIDEENATGNKALRTRCRRLPRLEPGAARGKGAPNARWPTPTRRARLHSLKHFR